MCSLWQWLPAPSKCKANSHTDTSNFSNSSDTGVRVTLGLPKRDDVKMTYLPSDENVGGDRCDTYGHHPNQHYVGAYARRWGFLSRFQVFKVDLAWFFITPSMGLTSQTR